MYTICSSDLCADYGWERLAIILVQSEHVYYQKKRWLCGNRMQTAGTGGTHEKEESKRHMEKSGGAV